MTKKKLHPSVEEFKEFVKQNPKIIQEVRKGQASWQELYEDWYLLGEEDSRWDDFREGLEKKKTTTSTDNSNWVSNIMGMVKNMDPNQVQTHISSLSQALGAIQGVITQFQGGSSSQSQSNQQPSQQQQPSHPFQFRKD
ncbi:YlbD family protein [Cytobacillus sp. FJAT-54145]|uniref:YlbD family protein n=1 Tax=Cytobacillus spartinae TaxID=3299023 RepID=A0ABW6KHD2_9BACI